MAHFRGVINGARGEASRLGTKRSGLQTVAQTWGGQVVTRLWHDDKRGDMMRIFVEGNPCVYGDMGKTVEIFYGPLASLRNGHVDGKLTTQLDAEGEYIQ